MSLLTMLQTAAREMGITSPVSVVSASDEQAQQLLALAQREGKELRSTYDWPQLQKEVTITTVSGQANYALPADFERFVFNTEWDRTNHWEILGPASPQEWQFRKSGIVNAGPRFRFRVKGVADNQFYIDPTPSSSGTVIAFEYITTNWILPINWSAGYTFLANRYCSYNGNIYVTSAGGVTGVTPPTHTSGSVNDGGVTWTHSSAEYSQFLADTDFPVLREEIVGLGVQWRFLRMKGLEWQTIRADYEQAVRREVTAFKGAPVLSLGGTGTPALMGYYNIPDSGYGS